MSDSSLSRTGDSPFEAVARASAKAAADQRNLLSDLPSLQRMTKRDQRTLDRRLRALAFDKTLPVALRANLVRATYELEKT